MCNECPKIAKEPKGTQGLDNVSKHVHNMVMIG